MCGFGLVGLCHSNSIRTKKTVDGVTTESFLNGSTVLSQVTGGTQQDFFYDDLGNAIGFIRNGTEKYYYLSLIHI